MFPRRCQKTRRQGACFSAHSCILTRIAVMGSLDRRAIGSVSFARRRSVGCVTASLLFDDDQRHSFTSCPASTTVVDFVVVMPITRGKLTLSTSSYASGSIVSRFHDCNWASARRHMRSSKNVGILFRDGPHPYAHTGPSGKGGLHYKKGGEKNLSPKSLGSLFA
jgi:hypothetical protein